MTDVLGKLQPQAIDLEQAVLGALMLEPAVYHDVKGFVGQDTFYKEAHFHIWMAIEELHNDSQPVDILTVTEQLVKMNKIDAVGGPFYISELTNRVASAANTEAHAAILKQKQMRREMIRVASDSIKGAYDDAEDVFNLLDTMRSQTDKVDQFLGSSIHGSSRLLKDLLDQNEKAANNFESGIVNGIPTDLDELDRATGGYQPTDLIIVAARPGMGKTAFIKNLIKGCVLKAEMPIGIIELEMSKLQLIIRLFSEYLKHTAQDILKGKIRIGRPDIKGELKDVFYGKEHKEMVFIDDTPALHINAIRSKAIKLKQQHGIGMLVVDYIQLARGDGDNREQEISQISRGLKGIAKELEIPVVAFSQLNRSVEKRENKKPNLSDLRESGAIEQDADMVMFLYRPEYYEIEQCEVNGKWYNAEGLAVMIIEKHRNGGLDKIVVDFDGPHTQFSNHVEEVEYDEPRTPHNSE